MSTSKKNTKTTSDVSAVYVYIGPSIKGVIQHGSIYRGTKTDVLQKIYAAVTKYPKISALIVRSTEIAEAKNKIKLGGNSLSIAYRTLLSELSE